MEETALGDKYIFSLESSVPASQSLSLLCLTPNITKINTAFRGLPHALLGNFPSPEVAVTAHLGTDGDLWADRAFHQQEPSSGSSQIHPSISRDTAEANPAAPLCTGSLAEKGGLHFFDFQDSNGSSRGKGIIFFPPRLGVLFQVSSHAGSNNNLLWKLLAAQWQIAHGQWWQNLIRALRMQPV